ncbi:MAG: undecaprenyldiphospho-muramoylpentapeptide beta-N-acetylglucosaminyltransferase [Porticoccaceae bacterium]|nr:undecaprenyldiphospho-muramoylpentapeptide beta-N-acetylglucosaminyltransferase [Porticoccaceae bacterium]
MKNNKPSLNTMRVMIMAGGTGGHVFPALAVTETLQQQQVTVSWLGTRKGIEAELIPKQGIELHYLTIEGLRGRGLLALLRAPFKLVASVIQACSALTKFNPSVVLGMGGFVSGPGAIAAKLKGIPLVIHEQNSVAGTTNRLLAKMATCVMQGFPNTFKQGDHCGNPVRAEIAAIKPPVERFADRQGPMRLLVLGGSRGALAINQLIPEALAKIEPQQRPQILHQVGGQHQKTTQDLYIAQGHNIESESIQIVPFIDSMEEAYEWADFVICRSGALTVAELTAVGLGAILIPFPYAIDDHQTTNGEWLVNSGAGLMIQQRDIRSQDLADQIVNLANNPNTRLTMASNARSLAKNGAAERVAEVCMEVANG